MAHDAPTSPPNAADVQAADKRAELRRAALEYHRYPNPGKISIAPTTQLINQHDLVATSKRKGLKQPQTAVRATSVQKYQRCAGPMAFVMNPYPGMANDWPEQRRAVSC